MPLTSAGINWITQVVANFSSPVFYNSANAYIGVGDSSTAFSTNQTDLQAASNKTRVVQDSGYPTYMSGNVLTYQATYTAAVANWVWNEWGVFNASSSGTMMNRKVESNGTKSSGQTWVFQTQLTFNIGT